MMSIDEIRNLIEALESTRDACYEAKYLTEDRGSYAELQDEVYQHYGWTLFDSAKEAIEQAIDALESTADYFDEAIIVCEELIEGYDDIEDEEEDDEEDEPSDD